MQGPGDAFALPHGNAATSVVWNPVRRLFVAAVRYHGYYQSADGVTWTRLADAARRGTVHGECALRIRRPSAQWRARSFAERWPLIR